MQAMGTKKIENTFYAQRYKTKGCRLGIRLKQIILEVDGTNIKLTNKKSNGTNEKLKKTAK